MSPSIPPRFAGDVARLPAALRAIVEAELAVGNEIREALSGFPVAPVGVGIRFMRALSVLPPSAAAGACPCRFPNWDGSGGYSDEPGRSFVLGPPVRPPDPPGTEETRAARTSPAVSASLLKRLIRAVTDDSPLARFEQSLIIDYEKWHDGIGYDLEAIREASPEERAAIEARLLQRGARDWRDVEALAVLNSPQAREALRMAMVSRDQEVALAVARHAPDVLTEAERVALIVRGLEQATFYGGLSQALDQAADCHPAAVIEALLHGALKRDGDIAVHFAAMLMFLHGRAKTAFEMEQRPFFLTFNTPDRAAREAAFRELCRKIGVEASRYLTR